MDFQIQCKLTVVILKMNINLFNADINIENNKYIVAKVNVSLPLYFQVLFIFYNFGLNIFLLLVSRNMDPLYLRFSSPGKVSHQVETKWNYIEMQAEARIKR